MLDCCTAARCWMACPTYQRWTAEPLMRLFNANKASLRHEVPVIGCFHSRLAIHISCTVCMSTTACHFSH
jgi:hypothetical protein